MKIQYFSDYEMPTIQINFRDNNIPFLTIAPYQQWSQLFQRKLNNWCAYDLIKFYVEDDKIMGAIELDIALLGLGVRFNYTYKTTEMVKNLKELIKEIDKGNTG